MTGIKRARMLAGYTQSDLAKLMGVSHVTVCKWDSGRMFPNVKRLKELAEVLGTTVEKLLPDSGKEAG